MVESAKVMAIGLDRAAARPTDAEALAAMRSNREFEKHSGFGRFATKRFTLPPIRASIRRLGNIGRAFDEIVEIRAGRGRRRACRRAPRHSPPAPTSCSACVLEPPHLDPTAGAAAAIDEVLYANVFEGLTRIGSRGEVLPALAESWTVSDDGKVYTFKLHTGVKYP